MHKLKFLTTKVNSYNLVKLSYLHVDRFLISWSITFGLFKISMPDWWLIARSFSVFSCKLLNHCLNSTYVMYVYVELVKNKRKGIPSLFPDILLLKLSFLWHEILRQQLKLFAFKKDLLFGKIDVADKWQSQFFRNSKMKRKCWNNSKFTIRLASPS